MDEQMYLGASEVDGLTSLFADSQFALSNSSLDGENTSTDLSLYPALRLVEARLRRFAFDPLFAAKMQLAFGSQLNDARLVTLQQAWASGDFSLIPQIYILPGTDIGRANGAFASARNEIYLSQEFILNHNGDGEAITSVILEEIGHWVDTQINSIDAPGDEGAIFAALVQGNSLDAETLGILKAEDDSAIITINGEEITIEQNASTIQTTTGDGGLKITVDELGGFSDAFYDPIGSKTSSSTTFESFVALGIINANGTNGRRTELETFASNNEVFTTTNNNATDSTFMINGLQFQLNQTVQDTLNSTSARTGGRLDQTYTITNTTAQTINFDLVRYVDGDLLFDGSLVDGGGRTVQNGQEILFETDSGGTGQTDTTFFGISSIGGTIPTANRWEIDRYSVLRSNVLIGNSLRDIIVQGDSDSNQFIDPGSEYDVTLALRNVFSLAPGQSTTYTTTTRFGSGDPTQLDITPPTGGIGNLSITTLGNNITVTWGSIDPSGIKNYDVFVSVDGAAFIPFQTDVTTTTAVYTGDIGKTYTFYSLATDNAGNEQSATTAPTTSTRLVNAVPGTLSFSASGFSVRESDTNNKVVTITRTGGTDGAISVTINFNDGTAKTPSDYSNAPITVDFANGESSKTVTIPIVNDSILEPNETLSLSLSNPTGGATIGQQRSTTLTIVDRDAPDITGFPNGLVGSNLGQATITITGKNFLPTDRLSLIDSSGNIRNASKVYWVSGSEIWATFDLVGLTPGKYDVSVAGNHNVATVNDAYTVTAGVVGSIQTTLSYPAQGVAMVAYTNIGETDVVAPLFRVTATNAQVDFPAETTTSNTLRQLFNLSLGTNSGGPTAILSPGESGEFSFAYTPSGNGLITFAVEQVPASEVIDWAAIKTELRAEYSFIDAAAWDVIWSKLTAALGQTVGDFQAVMAEDANYLSQLGQPTNDITRLFAFEWKQTVNTLTNVALINTTDVVDDAPGLSLTFGRTFYQSLAERYNLGSLGRGWASEWDLRATKDSQGNVVIRSVGGLQRVFELQTNGAYLESGGATLTIDNAGGYRLREANGTVSVFASDGKLSFVEDTNGNRITLEYTNNLLTRLVHTNGDSLTLGYNAFGRVSQVTDSLGEVTTYSYDATGEHLLSVTSPEGTTTYSYDTGAVATTLHSLLSVTTEQGYQRNFEYDSQGRLSQESSNGQAQTLSYSYDSVGGVTVKDSTGAVQTVLFNDRGNAGQLLSGEGQNLLFRYDNNGNLVGVTLPDGSQNIYSYDSNGNLTQQTNSRGQTPTLTFDPTFDLLTGFQDPKGNRVNYTYDSTGNLSKITYSDGSTQNYSVDVLGNVTSYVNRRGIIIQYTYNPNEQLTQKLYADGTSATYGYDIRGNLTSVIDATGTTTLQYESAMRITSIVYPTGKSLQYSYNSDGQRTQMVQDGYTVNYSYDAVGWLKTLTDGVGQTIIIYDYDAAGRLTKEINGNGTYTTYNYDALGQLTRLVNYDANAAVNSSFEYAYNNLGLRTSMTTLDGTFEYGYDATGQLTSVVTPTGRTINYQYDAAGNRIGVTDSGTTTNYSTNELNQYTDVGNAVYTYDADGNLVGQTLGGQTSNYTYDAENRLNKVVTPQGTWEYQYDGLGNRVASTFNGQKTEYLIDPFGLGNVVGEYDNSGNLVARYTHGVGLVSRVDGSNIADYYDADALGSTVGLTSANGSYVNRYSYLPFGEDLTKIESVANPFEYVGQWGVMDEGNGLDFMQARFYDSNLGRFTTVDPINVNGGDTNFYRYVENNPTSYTDPIGLSVFSDLFNYLNEQLNSYVAPNRFRGPNGECGSQYTDANAPIDLKHYQVARLISRTLTGATFLLTRNPFFSVGVGFLGTNLLGAVWEGVQYVSGYKGSSGRLQDWRSNFLGSIAGSTFQDFFPPEKCPPEPPENPTLPTPTPAPTPSGRTYNDPHLKTLDGLGYDFQTVGEFTLVKSTTDDLEIQTRQQPWRSSTNASSNAAIAIQSDGQRIAIYADQTQRLFINGSATTLPDGALYAVGQNLIIRQGNQYRIITANNDLILVNDRGTFLNINLGLSDDRDSKIVGLLGNNNDDRNDEFALRDGTAIGSTITRQQLYGDYGNSWRITQATSLFDYAPGTNTDTFTDLNFPLNIVTIDDLTPQQRSAAEQIARDAGITDPVVLEDAIVDIFLTNGAPEFIQGAISQQRFNTVNAPNTSINPDGFGIEHWLTAGTVIPYTIRFSNNAIVGTAPVVTVTVTQALDPDLDFNTFELQDISFGTINIDVPPGAQTFSQRIDLLTTRGIFVDVNAGLDPTTGIVTWTFTAIDPATGNPITDPTQGFLPPNDSSGIGQGIVGYSIQPKTSAASGSRIDAQTSITFDNQPVILTNAVFNTLDKDLPSSQVAPLTNSGNPDFIVSWFGSDPSSGIAVYDIYVSVNGGQYTAWQSNTTATSATYTGQAGSTYRFYSIAKDNIGNTEAPPLVADAEISIVPINDEPAGTDNTVTTLIDTPYTFTPSDFGFSDPQDTPANNLLAVKISTLPTKGTLINNGTPVNVGDSISVTDITAGTLQFIPEANTKGLNYANFTFQVQDDGGTANGGIDLDLTPNLITLNVAPSGSSTGDPHILTFDGLHYDFQAIGDFVLVKALDSDLEIQVRQAPWSVSPTTTLNVGLATTLDGKQLEFSIDQPFPLLDGIPLALGLNKSQPLGNGSISRTSINGYGTQGDLYTINYANGDRLLLNIFADFLIDPTLHLNSSQTVIGLLGNNNGLIEDDLALRNGTLSPQANTPDYLLTEFAASWQVTPETSLFRNQALPLHSQLLMGTAGSDNLIGGLGNDILVGIIPSQRNSGTGEIDLLTGSQGSDTFVLGDKNSAFYLGSGSQDYALIQDFSLQEGDIIQLKGNASEYILGSISTDPAAGTGIFLASEPNELVGAIAGLQPQTLTLSSPAFQYV
jgi:RHS repeat-associated protein